MKEYFVLSDVHGFFTEMMTALSKEGFEIENKEHIVILCGDMLDRGLEAAKTVDFFYKLHTEGRLIFIRGNHEDLFVDMVKRKYIWDVDVSNGTLLTLYQLAYPEDIIEDTSKSRHSAKYKAKLKFNESIRKYDSRWDALIRDSVDFYETKNYIFVHGWIPVIERVYEKYEYDPDWRTATRGEWNLARWLNGMYCASLGVIENGKTIVCGHWDTAYMNIRKLEPDLSRSSYSQFEFDDSRHTKEELMGIYEGKGIIALDACTAWSGFCNCLHISEKDI